MIKIYDVLNAYKNETQWKWEFKKQIHHHVKKIIYISSQVFPFLEFIYFTVFTKVDYFDFVYEFIVSMLHVVFKRGGDMEGPTQYKNIVLMNYNHSDD